MTDRARFDQLALSINQNIAELTVERKPRLFVLSGPSGVGKDAMAERLKPLLPEMHNVITATTRAPREHEIDGVHYYFLDDEVFEEWIQTGELLEWSWVYDHRYGVPKRSIMQGLDRGKDTFVKIDVQGAAKLRELFPDAVQIFLSPGSAQELWRRLSVRGTETMEDRLLRFAKAADEMPRASEFDYVVFNRENEAVEAAAQILKIIQTETGRNC